MHGIVKLAWSLAALGIAIAAGTALFLFAVVLIPSAAGAAVGVVLATVGLAVVLALAALLRDGGPAL